MSEGNMLLNAVSTTTCFMDKRQLDAIADNYPVINLPNNLMPSQNGELEFVLDSRRFNTYDINLLSNLIGQDASEFNGKYVHIIAKS
ncbi:MAG: hypothetical protein ACI9T7_000129 [Oleiphilaceae bacterium]|jgi:hypothetical protein